MARTIPDDPVHPLLSYRLTICGLRELDSYCADGVTHVLSILDPDWPDPESFAAYGPHAREIFHFDDVVETKEGMVGPGIADIERLLRFGDRLSQEDVAHLLVHCHAGVSRSTAAAAILMSQHNPGREAEAFAYIARIRPRSWPNSLMVRMADERLGREGALIEGLREHHRRVARDHPDLAELIRLHGRAHEIPEDLLD